MIVKFSCDCIGIPSITNEEGHMLILSPCDLSGEDVWEPYSMNFRNMEGKTWEPLPQAESLEIIRTLNLLIRDGYRFQQAKRLLS